MSPVAEKGEWLSYYRWQREPGKFERVPVENVVHFRLGLDDQDMRRGLSPLKSLVRSISTDEEADRFMDQLLRNYAVPGLVVMPAGGGTMTEDDADRISLKLRHKFGSDNRGNVAVMTRESVVSQFGFSPKDLDMSVLHRIPEERISAVIGVPAIVAGLGAGLDRATYSNARALRELFTEQRLIPGWRSDAAKLTRSLKPDFEQDRSVYLQFDLSGVRALQEDMDAKYGRLQKAVGRPFMTVNEARTEVGLDVVEGGDELGGPVAAAPRPGVAQEPEEPEEQEGQEPEEGSMDQEQEDGLRAYEGWVYKRLRAGQSVYGYSSMSVPAGLVSAVEARLQVRSKASGSLVRSDVREAFGSVWRWRWYP
jgi:HK97 family phage portal protein